MTDKLMYFFNDDTQNYSLQFLQTFEHSTWNNQSKFPKLLSQWIRNCYYKTLGTSAINSPMSPPSLHTHTQFYIFLHREPKNLWHIKYLRMSTHTLTMMTTSIPSKEQKYLYKKSKQKNKSNIKDVQKKFNYFY